MRIRALALVSALCALLCPGREARAAGAWVSASAITPIEQRVAVAAGPDRTTLWTSLLLSSPATTLGLVLPVPPGSALDFSTDAWFEALQDATAPRVYYSGPSSATCSADGPTYAGPEIAGDTSHVASLQAATVDVLASPSEVAVWAKKLGLSVPAAIQETLDGLEGSWFVAVRFDAPAGAGTVTQTLRAVMPGAAPTVPLTLTQAGSEPLLVTTFIAGSGEGTLDGATAMSLAYEDVHWDASLGLSNYVAQREELLDTPDTSLEEDVSRSVWVHGDSAWLDHGDGTGEMLTVESVLATYFERASAYEGTGGAADCVDTASAAFSSSSPVATSCPRASLGVAGPAKPCVETPTTASIDPATLRCGTLADDLAVALSGLTPRHVWLTRQAMILAPGATGHAYPIAFQPTKPGTAFVDLATVSYTHCAVPPSSAAGSGGRGGSGGSGSVQFGGGAGGYGHGGEGGRGGGGASPGGSSSGCDCSGGADAAADGAEGCGDAAEGCGEAAGAIGDGLEGLQCSVTVRRPPRLSGILMALAAIVLPLRRLGRRRRPGRGAP